MQYKEDQTFLYRDQPSNKRKYIAMALGLVMVVGAVYYYNQPEELYLPSENVLQHNHTPESHITMTGELRATMLTETNIRRCMHGAPAVTWNNAMYGDVEREFGHATQMQHSNSYDATQAGGPAGENLYMSSGTADPAAAVDAWYDEVKACGAFPGCKAGASGTTGHFTALVWKGVEHIACTRSASKTGLIACRYGNGPGSSLSAATPNMGGAYTSNVLAQVKDFQTCAEEVDGSGGNQGGHGGNQGGHGGNQGGHGGNQAGHAQPGQDNRACLNFYVGNSQHSCSAYAHAGYCSHSILKMCCKKSCHINH